MPNTDKELRESWFSPRADDSTPSILPALRERSRSATWALGATTGAIGGVVGIFLASWATPKFGAAIDLAGAVGRALGYGREAGFAIAAIIGALVGGVLALTIQHGRRWIGRLVFASSASVTIWFCVHLALVSRHHATLPLAPMLIGAAALGAMVAFVPPSRS
ncbi:MAG TPA: hypothetical protein VGH28_17360 [Polyangiaceae bacterium]|jgi:MFS family permease